MATGGGRQIAELPTNFSRSMTRRWWTTDRRANPDNYVLDDDRWWTAIVGRGTCTCSTMTGGGRQSSGGSFYVLDDDRWWTAIVGR